MSSWNFFSNHRRDELYAVFHGNVLGFARRDELYTVRPGNVLEFSRSNNCMQFSMSNVVSRQAILDVCV
jgi:hypothetical protein